MTDPILPATYGSGPTPSREGAMPVCSPWTRSICQGPFSPQASFLLPYYVRKAPGSGATSHGKVAKSGLAKGSLHNPSP